MKRIKRIFCILVAVAMTLTAFDASAQGQSVRPGKRIENRSKPKQTPGGSSKQSGKSAKPKVSVEEVFDGPFKGKRYAIGNVSFVMINVPGGTFTMGATAEQGSDADSDEKPTHSVTLSGYMIGQTEVTQELWTAVMGSNPSYFKGSNLPVEQVSWEDCQTFIARLNQLTGERFRLPTEAEWEYAARGGTSYGTKYAGNNYLGVVAWSFEYSTYTVATTQPNALGIYDMSGNVWEWCQDWYGSYSASAQTNPQGPSSGSLRVLRGGGWDSPAEGCRVSFRNYDNPPSRGYNLGLRLAR